MLEVRRYQPEQAEEWNAFVAESKNGTFLFDRRYMDYHANRFADHSLLFYRNEKLYALLPANLVGNTLYSHQGLTYGGLVMGCQATTVHVAEVFRLMASHCAHCGIERVVYKAVPWIYTTLPAEEPLYTLHVDCHARLLERDISSAMVMERPLKWKKDRRHGLRVATENGVHVRTTENYAPFWDILKENLSTRHGVKPVHTLQEIELLHSRFPQQIVLYEAMHEQQLVGGCVVYVMPQVVHTQYIAATPEGKRMGAVDALVAHLAKTYTAQTFLDFGKSTESHCDQLNEHLIYQKEGFGARAVCYDTYEWTITDPDEAEQ